MCYQNITFINRLMFYYRSCDTIIIPVLFIVEIYEITFFEEKNCTCTIIKKMM